MSGEVEGEPGDAYYAGFLIESLNGAPSAATLTAQWQMRPIQANMAVINSESSGVLRPWVPVLSSDTYLGQYLTDGDWPTINSAAYQNRPFTSAGSTTAYAAVGGSAPFTNGPSGTIMVERGIKFGAFARQVRLVLYATFTGGTTPSWAVTGLGNMRPQT